MVSTLPNLIRLLQKPCARSLPSHAVKVEAKSASRSYSQNNASACIRTGTRNAVKTGTRCLRETQATDRNRIPLWFSSIQRHHHYGQKRAFSASNLQAARKWRPIEQLRTRHFLGVSYVSLGKKDAKKILQPCKYCALMCSQSHFHGKLE